MLRALYYPFSRCIDASALKQLLLVFDSVTFLDPVDDDEWRAKLFRDLEKVEVGHDRPTSEALSGIREST